MPVRRLLVCMGSAEDGSFIPPAARQLEPDRQTLSGEPARNRYRRDAEEVEWVCEPNKVERDLKVAFLDGPRCNWCRRRSNYFHFREDLGSPGRDCHFSPPLGLHVMHRKKGRAELEAVADVVAIVVRPFGHPLLMVRQRFGQHDCRHAAGDLADERGVDFDDDGAHCLEQAKGGANSALYFRIHVLEEELLRYADTEALDSNSYRLVVIGQRLVARRSVRVIPAGDRLQDDPGVLDCARHGTHMVEGPAKRQYAPLADAAVSRLQADDAAQ